jgi:hypothetical protein
MKLKASSLTEVLIALAIASVIFVIGTMVFLNLAGPGNLARKAEYRWVTRSLLNEAIATRNPQEIRLEVLGAKFTRTCKPINPAAGLYEAKVICLSAKDEVLMERTKVIHIPVE